MLARRLLSVRGEDALWFAYRNRIEAFGLGVSAMPSVHIRGGGTHVRFSASHSPGGSAVLLSIVAVCTFVASVELGWHYALDGYVGALIACAIWWLAGRVTRDPAA